MMLDLKRQGLKISAIAQQMQLDRKTVRKYLDRGGITPSYGPRQPRARLTDPFEGYVRDRLNQFPKLSCARLLREIKPMGYIGGRSVLAELVQSLRPPPLSEHYEVRFETGPGVQAQVDFAEFAVQWHNPKQPAFSELPRTKIWLFYMVLGHSRYGWGKFVLHQDLPTVIACHQQAFAQFGGVPKQILYDQMRTVVKCKSRDLI